jgi:iron complex outermembrane receptor protein
MKGMLGAAVIGGLHIAPALAQSPEPPAERQAATPLPEVRVAGQRARPRRPANTAPAPRQVQAQPAEVRETARGPVTGVLAHQSATATKTDTPILETPQSISVVTRDQIQAQGAQTLSESLRYTPGLSLEAFNANAFFDSVKIRGFDAPRYLDGLRIPADTVLFAVPRIETYGLERIEVLKGPSSGLYGQSDPGGLLNMVSKRPTATPHYEVEGTFGSFDRIQGAFDIGGPVDKNGEFLYRLVGLARKSDTQVDYVQDNKLFIAPSLTWRPSTDTSFTILSHYQKIDNKGYQQYVPGEASLLPNPYGRIPYSRYLGEPAHDRYKLEQGAIGYEFEHRFDNNLQVRQNLRYMDVTMDMQAFRGDSLVLSRYFYRTPIYVKATASNLAVDNQAQVDFRTGLLTHKALVGFDYQNSRSSNDSRLANPFTAPLNYFPIDVFNPVYGTFVVPPASALFPYINMNTKLEQAGLYAQDQIKLDRWTLSLTGRQDWASSEMTSVGFFPLPGRYQRSDNAATGRVGLNYLFDFGLSPYANYSTSFVPNPGADIYGNTFKPTTGEGKEVGIKFMPTGTNLMFTAALFEIVQQNVLTGDPATGGLTYVQTDAARVRGYEFEVRGNVTREFEIVAGYSHLDPVVTKSVAGNVGKYLPNVNREQASLWGKYTWYDGALAGLGLGAGVRYVGENYGDFANTIYIPSYTLFDASVSYDLAYARPDLKGWKAQINATNLGNKYYVTSCQSALSYCGLGTARTVLGTLKYSWN